MAKIQVEFENVLVKDVKVYRLTNFSALSATELPQEYMTGRPRVYADGDALRVRSNAQSYTLKVGSMLTNTQLAGLMQTIEHSGNRLHEINKVLAHKRAVAQRQEKQKQNNSVKPEWEGVRWHREF